MWNLLPNIPPCNGITILDGINLRGDGRDDIRVRQCHKVRIRRTNMIDDLEIGRFGIRERGNLPVVVVRTVGGIPQTGSSRSVTGHGINATHFADDAGASPLDYSFTHTLVWGYNRMILIAVMGDTTGTPDAAVTYGGVTATFLAQQLDPGSNQFVRWHYIQEVSLPSATSTDPQSYTVVVSRTNDGPQRCWVGAFEQVSQVNPPTAGGGSLTSPATTASIATVPAAFSRRP